MGILEDLKKEYEEYDKYIDSLIEKNPWGWHDKELEILLIKKSKYEGALMLQKEIEGKK